MAQWRRGKLGEFGISNDPCQGQEFSAPSSPNGRHRSMSHHYSGPNVGFPHGDARLDITDLFAFPKPGDAQKSILILSVHPSFSLEPLEPTRVDPFASDALYEFKIDTDGDAVADIAYRLRSRHLQTGAKPRRCSTLKAPKPPEWAMMG